MVNSLRSTLMPPILRMIGESEDVVLTHEDHGPPVSITFYNNTAVVLVNLVLINLGVNLLSNSSLKMSSVSLLNCQSYFDKNTQVSVEHSVFADGYWLDKSSELVLLNCTFLNVLQFAVGYTVSVENCSFINSPMQVAQGNNVLTISGVTVFKNATQYSALVCSNSSVIMSGAISFENNHGVRGGAMSLYLTTLNITVNTNVTFINNSAEQWGGAIYVAPGIVPDVTLNSYNVPSCFYSLLNCSFNYLSYYFVFEGNSATYGGDDIYGLSRIAGYCFYHHTYPCGLTISGASSSNSSISSAPLRVCICDNDGKPQCENNSYIAVNYDVHPGELITIPVVLVGGDLGLTTGTVYASIYPPVNYLSTPTVTLSPDYGQAVASTSTCTEVDYTIYSRNNSFIGVFLTSTVLVNPNYFYYNYLPSKQCDINKRICFLYSQVFVNFTILPCPPGFTLLEDPPRCDCYPLLTNLLNVTCSITKQTGYFSWTGDLWMNVQENEITYDKYCPHNYCIKGNKRIDLLNNSNSQCDFNRAGRLCGECKDGYSLAIGSSNCILCQNSNNLALLIFFAVAGFLLVFFIGFLNITVTQGLINGLIFYANIIWTYKDIFFAQEGSTNAVMIFLKTFIAWINLDFGIETCFVEGFTAFWKTFLQFVFPLYVWAIAGLLIMASRCSTKLTKLLGNRAVPLLATLFLLSYMKLLRTAESALEFSILFHVDYTHGRETSSPFVVWSKDGNLGYCEFPHILLFVAGLATLLFLWMPYTLLLLLIQWLRRLPQRGPLKWILRPLPLYDAYLAPLKHRHHYWLGVLLLARGILLVTFASSFAIPQSINLLLLFIFGLALLYSMILTHPYKSRAVLILQSSYLMNLVVVSGLVFFTYTQPNGGVLQSVAVGISTGFTFLQFCGTVLYVVIAPRCCLKRPGLKRPGLHREHSALNNSGHRAELVVGDEYSRSHEFRDSILNESASVNGYRSL